MTAIYKNELKSYFTGMTGYVFIAFMLLFAGIYTMGICFTKGFPSFEYVLSNMSFCFFIIVPVLTMRVISEEKRQKTDQLLYSLPITMTDVILGKYFALLTVLIIPLCVMALYPILLAVFGADHLLPTYGALIGFFFMGAAFLAIGLFISSITDSQMIAAGLCFVVLLLNYFINDIAGIVSGTSGTALLIFLVISGAAALIVYVMTKSWFASLVSGSVLAIATLLTYYFKASLFVGLIPRLLLKLSLFNRFSDFVQGSFNLTQIVFFLSVSLLFVFLSVQSMEKRRWS